MTHTYFSRPFFSKTFKVGLWVLFAMAGYAETGLAGINPVAPRSKNLHLGFTSSFYQSTENYSQSGGGFNSLTGGGKFQEIQNTFLVDFDLNSRFRFKSAFNIAMTQTENSNYSKSNSYFDLIKLGGEGWFAPRQIPLVANLELTIPIFKPDYEGDDATASEGVYSVQTDFTLQPSWRSVRGNFQLGLLYLTENRGGRLPWNVGASYGLSTGRIEGGIRGFQTVMKDTSSAEDRQKRTNLIVAGQAGSLKYFSVDPSMQELYFSSRWGMIENLDLSTDVGYGINGSTYGKGFTLMIGVHWLMDSLFSGSTKRSEKPFNYEADKGYEESLFESADPSKVRAKPKPRRTKSIKSKLNDSQNIDQMLDETERSLED